MINEALNSVILKQGLSYEQARAVMNEIMTGTANEVQIAAFLSALATKQETVEEITACAAEMRNHATQINNDLDLLEIVGTGGDGAKSFNISTTAAIVIAAAGINIAKHGNRAASSNCGAADCLEALGVNISVPPEKALEMLKQIHICFLFAQKYHTAMKYVAPVRKQLKIRTIFNILGPLTNPARASRQILGVYSKDLVEPLAHVLSNLGVKRGLSVFGEDNLDEISASAQTTVCEFENGTFRTYTICPKDFGLKTGTKEEIIGGTPAENAEITRAVLQGKPGTCRTAILLNAGAGIYIGGGAKTFADGIRQAAEIIDSGAAIDKLNEFIRVSNEV